MAGAAPVWLDIMNHLHRRNSSKAPKPLPGLAMKQVSFLGNLEPRRQEWFLAGTEPDDLIVRERQHEIVRIVYPQPATIITLDPDIPADLQRVSFVGKFAGDTHEWQLDGRTIGASTSLLWKPERGRHMLSLIDGENNVADSVTFIVK
jgi:penicillin-binding protein 1C